VKDTYKPKTGDHLPYIGLEHIQEQGLRLLSIGDSDSVTSQKFRFKHNDVLFGKLRPYFRKVIKPNFAGVCSTDIWVARALEGNDQNFIFYFFANQEFVDTANSGDSGTRMPRADWHFVKDTIWQFPPLPEQRAIAGVLSSLDDKIDLLHRQNKTLEGMAEALWRKMFVEEAETEWQIGKLGDFIKTTSGGTPSRSRPDYYENGNYKWVKSKELQGTFIIDTEERITEEALSSSSAKLLPKNSLLLAMYGATVGEYGILTEQATCNQAVCALLPNENYPFTFIYMFLKMNKDGIINHAVGSAQQNISQIVIQNFELLKPNQAIIQFHKSVEGLFDKIKLNIFQIHTLSKMRDKLLPKLMSGEVRMSNE
jgi:type I restriction enzyme S subunit